MTASAPQRVRFKLSVRHFVCSFFYCACVSITGHVLRVGEGSVHGGLQHFFGVPHHGHGHPVQVQVRRLVVGEGTAAGWAGKHEIYQTCENLKQVN